MVASTRGGEASRHCGAGLGGRGSAGGFGVVVGGSGGAAGGYIPSPHNHPRRRATLGQATGGCSGSEIYSPADPTAMTLHFPNTHSGFYCSFRLGVKQEKEREEEAFCGNDRKQTLALHRHVV